MGWLFLLLASMFEGTWVVLLKYSGGFARPGLGILAWGLSFCSFGLLTLALRSGLHTASSYAIWVGIGFSGAVLGSIYVLKERVNAAQWVCVAVIAIGVLGLRFFTPDSVAP